ncbi:MAG TPA: amino acid adenylation domain-containing protein, partial [Candidatus Deferrimicrobium sp.]|nr:amino acid adenylation domain-containing protein [Candidatus Deferrimicrobium sp.]
PGPVALSYHELNEQSGGLAGFLVEKGVIPDTIVGLMMERSIEMVIGIFGVLKAGGAYLPIDPNYPKERIDYMRKDSRTQILLTTNEVASHSTGCIFNSHHSSFTIHHANLSYLIYTSGSTGKPKGVMVEHRSLDNLCRWHNTFYSVTARDRATKYAGFSFDASVWEIFPYLIAGASLYIVPEKIILDIWALNNYYERNHITITFLPTQLCEQFITLSNTSLRILLTGGDKLKNYIKQNYLLYNNYGPTENTVVATSYLVTGESHNIPIGKPVFNTRIYIMDHCHGLLPIGVPGELHIGGTGLARGYLNNPELTAEKFDRDLWDNLDKNKRFFGGKGAIFSKKAPCLYKTGDLTRWLPDGNIEFLGRIDQQVKIRGFRIEPGEIEFKLIRHEALSQAIVTVRTDRDGNKDLCAYIVSRHELNISELRQHLAHELPEYMIPSYFIKIEKIPLTASGKIDHNALPDPLEISLEDRLYYTPPTTPVEKKLVEIWQNVLGRHPIGTTENFFQVGGDSIKAIQIISRMNSAGYKLEMKNLFQYPIISQLAPHVTKQERIPDQSIVTGVIPLNPIQKRFFRQSHCAPHHFNQAVMFYSKEGFPVEITRDVFAKIQEHHDALRMTYEINRENGEVIQINHGLDYPLSFAEYEINDPAGLELQAEKLQAGIDLEKGPLMKLGLFHLNDGDRLLIAIHHLVIDGISWRILFEDIETLYSQYKRGEKPVLPPKTDSLKHWTENLSAYANSNTFLKEKTYWQKIESLEPLPVPRDFEVDGNDIKDTASISFTLKEEETELLLTKVNRAFGTEINDILLTALGMGIKKTFGLDRIAIALEGHGREDILAGIDISRTVGWFTALYPIIIDVSHAGDPGRQIKEIKETLRRIPNKGTGYGILKYLTDEENKKEIQFKLKPQISFNYLGQFDADVKQLSSFEPAKESPGNSLAPANKREYLLDVSGMIANNRLTMTVSFNKTHFTPATTAALANNFEFELGHLIAYCGSKKNSEFTPADFTYKDLSIENIDQLTALYPDLEDLYTLTPMQEGMLFHALVDHSSYSYFQQVSHRMLGELEIDLVEKSLNELVKRHDILRTAFVYKDIEKPVQVVLRDRVIGFYYEDISKIDGREAKELYLKRFREKDKERSFDLSKDTLMRAAIFRLEESEYEFTWSHHHILMDGWCTGILTAEFFEIYSGYLENKPSRLPGIKPYRTYIRWLEKQDKKESARYWENYLDSYEAQAGIPVPIHWKKTAGKTNRNSQQTFSIVLDIEKTTALNHLAAVNHVTLNTVAQALWGILLGKYNRTEDVVFGAVVSGRPVELEGVESMVGLFINTIPVRIRFEEKMKFYRLLRQVQQEALAGEPYHYHPLAEIQSRTALKQNLIDHILVFDNYPIAEQIAGYGKEKNKSNKIAIKLANVEVFEQTNYDFNVSMSGSDRLTVTFQYNDNIYDENFVKKIAAHFSLAFDQVSENRELVIGELTFLSEEEKNRILYEFNGTEAGAGYPGDQTVHGLFREQVERTPHRIALAGVDAMQLSYGELNERSGRLAGLLIEKGVQPDTIVAIMMERSLTMIIGIMGILKSGGAYLPIDPEYPQERIDYMLKDSGTQILLTAAECLLNFHHSSFIIPHSSHADHLAYIIYTSGSTGKPKGVVVKHKNLLGYTRSFQEEFKVKETDVVLQQASFSFDVFVEEVYPCLLVGGTLAVPPRHVIRDIVLLVNFIATQRITIIDCSPLLLNELNKSIPADKTSPLKTIHTVISGGDVLKGDYVAHFLETAAVYNTYGPAETTVCAAYYRLTGGEGTNIPIGKPIADYRVYILDMYRQLLPVGMAGEIVIGGVGTAAGYLNNPELTAEKFDRDYKRFFGGKGAIFSKKAPCLYKTGDLGRWLADGNIEFLGRIDRQIKIRGFRIELGEIEDRLASHPAVKEALVVANFTGEAEQHYLVGYITAEFALNHKELREHLSSRLPGYMIPAYFVQVETFPSTPHGKIDIAALPGPAAVSGNNYSAPRNNIEEKLIELWYD